MENEPEAQDPSIAGRGPPQGIFRPFKRSAQAALCAVFGTGVRQELPGIAYLIGNRSLAAGITSHCLVTLALELGPLKAAVTDECQARPAGFEPAT